MAGKSYFLCKIDGIGGESPDPKYVDFFELENWGLDVHMEATQQTGSGMLMGKATLGEFRFTKSVDKATPKLIEACAKGTHITKADLVARKQGRTSGELEEFVRWTFTNLVITSEQIGGMGEGGQLPLEHVSFAYEKLEFKYDEKKADGTSAGWQGASFDSKTNLAA